MTLHPIASAVIKWKIQTEYKQIDWNYYMSEQSYLFLSFCAILGVFISYIVPIVGGIIEDIVVLAANGLIISIVLKNKFGHRPSPINPKHVQIVETDEIELQAFEE